ncbi:MAG TPA: hypothetical protein VML55_15585 [Planctomycetaceae bacterium]|nr:hypothetical protein [Planctomycetaceae bacterium]
MLVLQRLSPLLLRPDVLGYRDRLLTRTTSEENSVNLPRQVKPITRERRDHVASRGPRGGLRPASVQCGCEYPDSNQWWCCNGAHYWNTGQPCPKT